jgi:tetratricopeptide (TPR) repeat protein
VTASPAPSLVSCRPPRDQRLQPYLQNQAMWGVMQTLVGIRHAGEDTDPRPLPQTPLSVFKRRCAANATTGSGPVPEALYFAFYADRYRVPAEDAITVPADHLWWLASEQDTVLLSDRATHHYTTVGQVDRERGRIAFYDNWPEDFFLRPGCNTLGIEAHGLSVSKAEFQRVIVGLVTWDTPQLAQHYFAAFPEQCENSDVLFRFGLALLDAEDDRLAPTAATLLLKAMHVAEQRQAPEMAAAAARQAYVAAACGATVALAARDSKTFEAIQATLKVVLADYGRDTIEAALSPRELTRLGNAAGNAREFKCALRVLDRAIDNDATFEDAYWLRASVRVQIGDAEGAAADALQAILLNDEALARLQAERAAIDPRGRWELSWKDRQIGGRRGRRESELATLLLARTRLGDIKGAREAAQGMIALRPDAALGYLKLAMVERAANRWAPAVE